MAYYTGNNYSFSSSHNIYIDENGVAYIFDRTLALIDRIVWGIICLAFLTLAVYLTTNSILEWRADMVVTTLKTMSKPVTELPFPAITICGSGRHMSLVESVLYTNFLKWSREHGREENEEAFQQYMEEDFQIKNGSGSILDILNTIIAPSPQSSAANAVRGNLVACQETGGDGGRRKRSIEGTQGMVE